MKKDKIVWFGIILGLIAIIHFTSNTNNNDTTAKKVYTKEDAVVAASKYSTADKKKAEAKKREQERLDSLNKANADTVNIEDEQTALAGQVEVELTVDNYTNDEASLTSKNEVANKATNEVAKVSSTPKRKSTSKGSSGKVSNAVSTAQSLVSTAHNSIDHQALANDLAVAELNLVNYKIAKKQIMTNAAVNIATEAIKTNAKTKSEVITNSVNTLNKVVDKANNANKELDELNKQVNELKKELEKIGK